MTTTEKPKDISRRMRYPYTFSAKVALFPWAYHFKHVWLYKWYCIGMVASFPVFYWINKQANSPANVAAFAKKKLEEEEAHALKHH